MYKKQLSFCLRYIDETGDTCEELLKYVTCQSELTGEELYNQIITSLENFNLDMKNCRGQGYNGAEPVGSLDILSLK